MVTKSLLIYLDSTITHQWSTVERTQYFGILHIEVCSRTSCEMKIKAKVTLDEDNVLSFTIVMKIVEST